MAISGRLHRTGIFCLMDILFVREDTLYSILLAHIHVLELFYGQFRSQFHIKKGFLIKIMVRTGTHLMKQIVCQM
jgi:hypothetical protein